MQLTGRSAPGSGAGAARLRRAAERRFVWARAREPAADAQVVRRTPRHFILGEHLPTEICQHDGGGRTEYVRDAHGRLLRMTDFDADGRVRLDTHYDVDSDGNTLGWRLFDRQGALFKRFEVREVAPGQTETLQYDATGALEYRFLEEERESGWIHRTFDAAGRELPDPGAA